MIVAVASGKGGTGKTMLATGMAAAVASIRSGADGGAVVQLLDCDVEEPNAHLFLNPHLQKTAEVVILTPTVDPDRCSGCRRCAELCAFHAIAVLGKEVLVFEEMCHGCGSCALGCPEGAISEKPRVTGVIEEGSAGKIAFGRGVLNVGEAMAAPVIRYLKRRLAEERGADRLVVLDAPPGSSCPVVECLRGADFALMVTEPTPFGLHDLEMAVQVARDELHLPVGVVVNRDGVGDSGVDDYCRDEGIPILMRIPLDRRSAEACSEGLPLPVALPEYLGPFLSLYHRLKEEVGL